MSIVKVIEVLGLVRKRDLTLFYSRFLSLNLRKKNLNSLRLKSDYYSYEDIVT